MKEVKKLDSSKYNWIELDWSELRGTYLDPKSKKRYVKEKDIDRFLEELYGAISRQLQVSYKELKRMIENENQSFFKRKDKMFSGFTYDEDAEELKELERMLRVPIKMK